MQIAADIIQPVRTDPLTGIGNLLGFADLLLDEGQAGRPRSLIALDLNGLGALERSHGDNALRWVALVLREELAAPVFRIDGDEFVALIGGPDYADHRAQAERLAGRLNREADRLGLRSPAVTLSIVHYRGDEPCSPADVLAQLQRATLRAKRGRPALVTAIDANAAPDELDLREVANRIVRRLVHLGDLLEISQQLATTDPVTGLPNMRAALHRLDQAVAQGGHFGLLLVDGDNLRRYNEMGYAAGDRMLMDLATSLRDQLRPSDFLARWRTGDEFMLLLPATGVSGGAALAERLRRRVEVVSAFWPFPVTISGGIAAYPQHGEQPADLIERAEEALGRAKSSGKNRVAVADRT